MTLSEPENLQSSFDGRIKLALRETLQWGACNMRAISAEFLSTAMLLFFGCMTNVAENILETKPAIYTAWGFGLTVMFNVQIFGHISGAHMNPAVTISSLISGYISVPIAIAYFIAQCFGSTFGYYLLTLVSPKGICGGCVTIPLNNLTAYQSLGIEIGITIVLCLLCCSIWDPVNSSRQDSTSVKFGLTVAGLCIIAGPLTGAGMNPARSLGPAIVTGSWRQHYIYWIGPVIGSVTAPLLYKIMTVPMKSREM